MSAESIQIRYSDQYEAFARLWMPPAVSSSSSVLPASVPPSPDSSAQNKEAAAIKEADTSKGPKGAILYLHGIQAHGGWFEASAQRLAEAGYVVLLPDRRGSGRNAQDRGHAVSAQRLLRDVAECCDELHVRTGVERVGLLGVSWGGKLAMAFYNQSPSRVASLTLIAPGLFPKVDLPVREKLRVVYSALFDPQRRFDIPLQQAELFTENPARQAFIRADALTLRQVTASFLIASRRLDGLAQRVSERTVHVPMSLFLAGQDRIIDNARTRQFIEQLRVEQLGAEQSTKAQRCIIEYPQAHHTLEFEPQPEPFFADLVAAVANAAK